MEFVHHDRVSYNAHSATPLIVGDFEVMKSWEGDPDGEGEGPIELESGTALGFDSADLAAPNIYIATNRIVMLVEEGSYGGERSIPVDEVAEILTGEPEKVYETFELEVTSGALVVTLRYNATPEVGSDTSHLSDLCFYEGAPMLPKEAPTEVSRLVTDQSQLLKESIIVPMSNGRYRFTSGKSGDFERFDIVGI